jgi:hypothetical protein
MNMNLIAELLSDMLNTPVPEPAPEVRLSDDWYEFEDTLGRYKMDYLATLGTLREKNSRLTRHMNDLNLLTNVTSMVQGDSIQSKLKSSIEDYRSEHNIDQLRADVNELNGTVAAMEGVLMNTNAKRYSAFTCPICMDRLVDTFLDPCGHLACERCLTRVSDLSACPTCRRQLTATKKMFPVM